jgi:hypothetical protein
MKTATQFLSQPLCRLYVLNNGLHVIMCALERRNTMTKK